MLHRILSVGLVALVILGLVITAISVALDDNDLANCSGIGAGDNCVTADVIVAVSGGDTAARARKAVELYQAGWAKKIIFSGAAADSKSISNAEAMKRIALADKVPASDILIEDQSKDTSENAQKTAKLLEGLEAKNVILVSSPYHLRRVKMNFVAASDDVNYRTAAATDDNWKLWFLSLNGWKLAITELVGIAELGTGGQS